MVTSRLQYTYRRAHVQVRLFKQQYPKFEKILPRRNWAEVHLKPPSGQYNR